ncbi:MAG: hypothetical protein GY828_03500 [Candidatus Gracilibacteria bacterium]|nr:hypothetical protein [Candidatus Gracilibacteria bacterium]
MTTPKRPDSLELKPLSELRNLSAAIITPANAVISKPIAIPTQKPEYKEEPELEQKILKYAEEIKYVRDEFFATTMKMKQEIENLRQMQYQLTEGYSDFVREVHSLPLKDQIFKIYQRGIIYFDQNQVKRLNKKETTKPH